MLVVTWMCKDRLLGSFVALVVVGIGFGLEA